MSASQPASFLRSPWAGVVIALAALAVVGIVWAANTVVPGQLQTAVTPLLQWPWLETTWLYAGLLIFTGSFPIIFGFLPQLKFYKVWGPLMLANLPVSAFFIIWDAYFTERGVWGFSSNYTSGIRWFGLPWEEVMFFVIIPAACTFIYWSLNAVIREEPFRRIEKQITLGLAAILFLAGLWRWEHIYTSTTMLFTSAFLLAHYLLVPAGYRGRFYLAYLVSCIPFLVVNGILTGGATAGPVVMYNPDEHIGFRVGTIPGDDFIYSLLMLFGNITLFEALLRRRKDRRYA